MPDARKTLSELREEWENCTKCDLGLRRVAMGGPFVFGEGKRRSVMFIGEGPGKEEEQGGRPFVGRSGKILRVVLDKIGLNDFYLSNVVSCRSCSPRLDEAGQAVLRKQNGRMLPIYFDEAPTPPQREACKPRLFEEIYLVDPILIVTLGAPAAELLLRRSVTITKDRGQTEHISIPGATYRPVLTEKKGAWYRKVHGEWVMPVEQNEVSYLALPTLHPAYVARRAADRGPNSPFNQFVADLRKALKIYERYLQEALGEAPANVTAAPDEEDLRVAAYASDDEDDE